MGYIYIITVVPRLTNIPYNERSERLFRVMNVVKSHVGDSRNELNLNGVR